jgi:hypothetical protein
MLGSYRSSLIAGVAVLVGIAGLTYVLAGAAAPPAGLAALSQRGVVEYPAQLTTPKRRR